MTAQIFIDGEAGTTGLQIRTRLEARDDLTFIRLDEDARKDRRARQDALNSADIAILCLPDAAARDAVALLDPAAGTRIIDASTAHRIADGWIYGFPEYDRRSRARIREGRFISNPGCYALTSVALLHPLISAGLVPAGWPISINAISGYSGGGKQLIAAFEDPDDVSRTHDNFRVYGLGLTHKHVPEIHRWSGLEQAPIFVPSVGRFAQGMLVQIPLPLHALPGTPTVARVHQTLAEHYDGERFVTVAPMEETLALGQLQPEALNGTNELHLHVLANEAAGQAVLVGLSDNLGKGASGQAVQSLNILLGCDESTGLIASETG